MTDTLQPVPFHQDTIFIIDHEGEPFVPVRPICDNMGIDWKSQYTKLTDERKRWNCGVIPTVATDGKQREMVCLPLTKLNGWLMGISPSKVAPEVKDRLIAYQDECDGVLFDYWFKGGAINPRKISAEVPAGMMLVSVLEHIGLYQRINALNEEAKDLLRQRIEDVNNKNVKRLNFTPEEDARVLELLAQGLSHNEIGKDIGRSRNSVCSCIRRQKGLRS